MRQHIVKFISQFSQVGALHSLYFMRVKAGDFFCNGGWEKEFICILKDEVRIGKKDSASCSFFAKQTDKEKLDICIQVRPHKNDILLVVKIW